MEGTSVLTLSWCQVARQAPRHSVRVVQDCEITLWLVGAAHGTSGLWRGEEATAVLTRRWLRGAGLVSTTGRDARSILLKISATGAHRSHVNHLSATVTIPGFTGSPWQAVCLRFAYPGKRELTFVAPGSHPKVDAVRPSRPAVCSDDFSHLDKQPYRLKLLALGAAR